MTMTSNRITTAEAAEILRVSTETVRVYGKSGILSTTTADNTFGRGRRMYFDVGEVRAFASGGAVAARAYRESRGPVSNKRIVNNRRKTKTTA